MVFKTKNSVFKQTKNSFNVKKKEKTVFMFFPTLAGMVLKLRYKHAVFFFYRVVTWKQRRGNWKSSLNLKQMVIPTGVVYSKE